MAGIAAAVPGNHIEDISAAVEDVAKPHGFGVIRQFVGHGIGTAMHEEPQVPNYRTGRRGRKLEPGLCLAIEPMFTLGDYRAHVLADDWTVSTVDGSLAAHFEDSIAIDGDRSDGRLMERMRMTGSCPHRTSRGPVSDRVDAVGTARRVCCRDRPSFDTLRVRVSAHPGPTLRVRKGST